MNLLLTFKFLLILLFQRVSFFVFASPGLLMYMFVGDGYKWGGN